MFPAIGVREPDSDGLVNEEDVRLFVPRVRVESDIVGVVDSAGAYGNVNIPIKHGVKLFFRTEFHEQSSGRRASRTTVRPENHVVLVRVAPALEKVKE